jgi:mono/diheme cytochrome c family protein
MNLWRTFAIITFLVAGSTTLMGLAAGQPPVVVQATPDSSTLMATMPVGGLIYLNMPANATQVDYGKEAYRLVCSACHGDKGQGLTAQWISTWAPEDQNCWKSKCHASNHPSDGFDLPHYVPAIFGRDKLQQFHSALDLEAYIRAEMPWQDKGNLKPEEYTNITAYLLKASGIDPMDHVLTPALAASILINPAAQSTAPTPTPTPASAPGGLLPSSFQPFWLGLAIFTFFLVILIIAAWFDSRHPRQ